MCCVYLRKTLEDLVKRHIRKWVRKSINLNSIIYVINYCIDTRV